MKRVIERKHVANADAKFTKNISLTLLSDKWHKVVFITVICLLSALVVLLFFTFQNKVENLMEEDIESQLLEVSLQSRNVLQFKLSEATMNLHGMASAFSKYENFSDPEIKEIMHDEVIRNGYDRMSISLPDGTSVSNDNTEINVTDREYFQSAMNGIDCISNVLDSRFTNDKIIVFAVPIFENNQVVGVLSAVNNLKRLEATMNVTSYDAQCYTYVIDSKGNIIFRPISKYVTTEYKTLVESVNLKEKDFETIDAISNDVKQRKNGVTKFEGTDEILKYAAYAPIEGINDWYAVSVISYDALTEKTNYIMFLTSALLIIVSIILACIATYIYYIKRSSQKTFEFLAFTDEITGCRSWSKFDLDMSDIFKKNKERNFAFIYQNIRNFKYINDIMGYEVGNDLLRYIAKVLTDNINSDEIFARISADRFALLIEYSSDSSIIKRLEQINDEISLFRSNYDINFELNVAFGVYKIKDKTLPSNIISDRALLAMETLDGVKDSNYGFYNSSIRQKALLVKELESEMQGALDDKDFIVYLQPKFDLINKEIVGAEALVRWMHPKRGLLPPGNFIDIFESNGFITKLDHYMFEETCKLLRKWIDSGKEPVPISVNLSKVHLYNPNIAEDLYCLALRYEIPTKYIEIELTESMNFDNIAMLLSVVDRLKRFDFTISIDDFGTGYSSLNLLKDLPVDVLKIDREFFSEAADQKRGRQVIASIIDMAKRLDMKTVAEGVEYKEQADFLIDINCDFVQGYYFSQPISISDFESKYVYNTNSQLK